MATTPETDLEGWIRLCRSEEIGEGQSRGFDLGDEDQDTIFVVRCRGALHAWRNACPHVDGAPMAWRRDAYLNADGTRIVCHAHGAQFMPDTGLCVQGPCLGKRLIPVGFVTDADGGLFVKI
ncbi:Rieske (2Fe-2S) protein [Bradyrhizobium sp. UFLA05-112]